MEEKQQKAKSGLLFYEIVELYLLFNAGRPYHCSIGEECIKGIFQTTTLR